MRVVSCSPVLVAVLLGAGAAFVLNSGYVPNAASSVFSTKGVRI